MINEDLPEELTLDLNLKAEKTLSSREGKGENVRQKEKHVKKHRDVNKCSIVQRLVLVDTCSIALVNQLAVVYPSEQCSIPGSGRSPGEGNGNPLQYSCLENHMDRGAWLATVHWGRKESDTTERLHYLLLFLSALHSI